MGVALFMLTVFCPGLTSGLLIVLNQIATDKKLSSKTLLRASLWGGGLILTIILVNTLATVREGHLGFWVAVSSLIALSAESIQRQ